MKILGLLEEMPVGGGVAGNAVVSAGACWGGTVPELANGSKQQCPPACRALPSPFPLKGSLVYSLS